MAETHDDLNMNFHIFASLSQQILDEKWNRFLQMLFCGIDSAEIGFDFSFFGSEVWNVMETLIYLIIFSASSKEIHNLSAFFREKTLQFWCHNNKGPHFVLHNFDRPLFAGSVVWKWHEYMFGDFHFFVIFVRVAFTRTSSVRSQKVETWL